MTETAKKIILFAAGLILTVGLIYIGFDIFHGTKKIADDITYSVSDNATKMQEEHITKHVNSFISGAMVASYLKEIYKDVETINIVPLNQPAYNAKLITENDLFRDIKTISSARYVNPLKNFYVTMERNPNGIISTIIITEQPD